MLKDYFRALKENDLRDIGRYLTSSYFKVANRRQVTRLFEELKKHHPEYKDIDNEYLANKLSINKRFLANIKSTLKGCIEHFLILNTLKKNEPLKTQLFAQALGDLNLKEKLIGYADEQINKIDAKDILEGKDYHLKYILLSSKYSIMSREKTDVKNTALETATETLSLYYLYEAITKLNVIHSIREILKKDLPLTEQLISAVKNVEAINDINIKASYLIYQYNNLKWDEEAEKIRRYKQLRDFIFDEWDNFPDVVKYENFWALLNIVRRYPNKILIKLRGEPFKIISFGIDKKKVHQIDTEIDYHLFVGIVKLSCAENKLDWCKKFIEDNEYLLNEAEKESTINLCLSYYDFEVGDFENAVPRLMATRSLGLDFELLVRILKLRCFYELKADDLFQAHYKATFNYINNHEEINELTKNYHLGFTKYLNDIRSARKRNGKEKLVKIRNRIGVEPGVINRIWLLKKINELLD